MKLHFEKVLSGSGGACHSALGRVKHQDYEFKASLGYIVRLSLKKQNQRLFA
jgi:hypothetical protein